MTVSLRLENEPNVEHLDFNEIEIIGVASGKQYARDRGGRELRIKGERMPLEASNPLRPAQLLIDLFDVYQDKTMAFPERRHRTFVADVVEQGSYQAAQAREASRAEARRRSEQPAYRAVDALAVAPALGPRLPWVLATSASSIDLPLHKDPPMIAKEGQPAIRGPRAILDHLDSKGIRLKPTPDGIGVLVYANRGRVNPSLREAIRATARLLAGELTGNPVSCELCRDKDRQPAITILEVDVAACEQHATEELPA